MHSIKSALMILCAVVCITGAAPASEADNPQAKATDLTGKPAEPGFVSLFNGKDFTGWIGTEGNEVKNGVMILKEKSSNPRTEKEYANFIFRFEFKLTPGANNGLGIRLGAHPAYGWTEIQILDDSAPEWKNLHPDQFHGSIYGVVPARRGFLRPVGEWNFEEVTARGRRIMVKLNGTTIVDADLDEASDPVTLDGEPHPGLKFTKGHIFFLNHTFNTEVRRIFIKELPPDAAADAVKVSVLPDRVRTPPPGFKALFDGKGLKGWKSVLPAPLDNPLERAKLDKKKLAEAQAQADQGMLTHWKAVNGELVFDGKGQSICTARDYEDFELMADWKIMARGDSGIYLRNCPQVQIWDPAMWPEGSGGLYNNQKYPSHPSVCADRRIGQWNTFRIKMIGERVTVHLNGIKVVDNVPLENYWDRSRPVFPKGGIELQNHGNTLYFRNLFIREIPRRNKAKRAS